MSGRSLVLYVDPDEAAMAMLPSSNSQKTPVIQDQLSRKCRTSDSGLGVIGLLLRGSVSRVGWICAIRPLECDPRESEAEAQAGSQRTHDGTRYLGGAADAAAVRNGDLDDAQTGSRGAHLHLQVPAIGHLAHSEPVERLPSDRAEGAHVGISDAVEQMCQRTRNVASCYLQGV